MNKKIITSRITTTQIEQDVEARIAKIRKRIQGMLLEESRIPSSVEDDAIKRYTTLVLDEIRAAKKGLDSITSDSSTVAGNRNMFP